MIQTIMFITLKISLLIMNILKNFEINIKVHLI